MTNEEKCLYKKIRQDTKNETIVWREFAYEYVGTVKFNDVIYEVKLKFNDNWPIGRCNYRLTIVGYELQIPLPWCIGKRLSWDIDYNIELYTQRYKLEQKDKQSLINKEIINKILPGCKEK